VVPPGRQLEKFRGRITCPSYNLNGDPRSALTALTSPAIGERRFVSKNVCHGVCYDCSVHDLVAAVKGRSLSLELIWKGMEKYLRERPEGKLLHDPLAACCAIDEAMGSWGEVEMYREKGEWGARLVPGSGTRTRRHGGGRKQGPGAAPRPAPFTRRPGAAGAAPGSFLCPRRPLQIRQ
jgi:pyrimidine-specific ribonucleoside hydrolase